MKQEQATLYVEALAPGIPAIINLTDILITLIVCVTAIKVARIIRGEK